MANVLIDDVLLREPNLAAPAKKPVGNVEIDWEHPLAQGLRSAFVFNGGGDLAVVDLVTGVESSIGRTSTPTQPTWETITGEISMLQRSAWGGIELNVPDISTFSQLTMFTRFIKRRLSASAGRFVSIRYSGGDDIRIYYVGNETTGVVYVGYDDGTAITHNTVQSIQQYDACTVGCVLTGSNDSTYFGIRNMSGVQYEFQHIATDSDSFDFSGTDGTLTLSNYLHTGAGADANFDFIYLFDIEKNYSELASLDADPYQILKPAGSSKQLISQPPEREVLVDDVLLREPNLALPKKKPIGKVILDNVHPLADGMIASWLFQDKSFKDLCGNYHGTEVGTVNVAPHSNGRANGFSSGGLGASIPADGTSDRINLGVITSSDPLSGVPSYALSCFVHCYISGSPLTTGHGNLYPRWIDKSTSGSGTNGWAFYPDVGVDKLYVSINGSNIQGNIDLNSIYGTDSTFSCSITPSTSTNTTSMYINGALDNTTATSKVFNGTSAYAALLNWNHSIDRQHRYPVYCIYVWDRVLSDEEHAEIHADPYQILKPA